MAEMDPPTAASSSAAAAKKSGRVLACVLCQQRKIKCDRRFPCAHCTKVGVKCIPAAQIARPRRRRFPERDLLDRLRHYESLLRQHNIDFEPMHPSHAGDRPLPDDAHPRDHSEPAESPASDGHGSSEPRTTHEPRTIWQAFNQKLNIDDASANDNDEGNDSDDSDDLPMSKVADQAMRVWDTIRFSSDPLLFGSQRTDTSLATLHPDQVHIFKFWQVYLDHVNPLLRVTHIPTLQARVIDAAANVENISPTLEPLMFAIYCIALMSLDDQACANLFVATKRDLLPVYRFGFQQALVKCEFMRTDDLDVLTALVLYLMSIGHDIDPRSLSSMLGIAVRISRRTGIHSEAANSKCPVLEAEMRRRLWYALIIFDSRISEMCMSKDSTLVPTWDCKPPLNINDFDLRPEMKTPPTSHAGATEMLFASVRCEMADFIRHSDYYLDFANPALKPIAQASSQYVNAPDGQVIRQLEKVIDDKYLKYCNPENPLHLMTAGVARGYIYKNMVLEGYARFLKAPSTQTDTDRDEGIERAIGMLDCDTQLMTAPQVVGFRWILNFTFPFAAYIHIIQDLQKRPASPNATRAWTAMNANYNARGMPSQQFSTNPFYKLLGGLIVKTWTSCVAANGDALAAPAMVLDIQFKSQLAASDQTTTTTTPSDSANTQATPDSSLGSGPSEAAMGSGTGATNDFNIPMTPMNMDFDFSADLGGARSPSAQWPAGASPMVNPFMMNWRALMASNVQFDRGRWESPWDSQQPSPWHPGFR